MATASPNDDILDDLSSLEEIVRLTTSKPVIKGFDTAALFLLGLGFENLFDPTGGSHHNDQFRCKGCRAIVVRGSRESHFARHQRAFARGDYGPQGGNMATNANKSSKTPKPTAQSQGFPVAYLSDNGNFKPGLDARAKSDLVNAFLGAPSKGALHTFTKEEAEKLLNARSWMVFVAKRQAAIANAEKRAKLAAEKKAAAAKTAAASKKATPKPKPAAAKTGAAKPDPKPKRKPQARRSGGGSLRRAK